jgi:predicted NUDIX family NTP pyrophosphohydrolase
LAGSTWPTRRRIRSSDLYQALVQHRHAHFAETGGVGAIKVVDRLAFFNLEQARARINPAQLPMLEELRQKLARGLQ